MVAFTRRGALAGIGSAAALAIAAGLETLAPEAAIAASADSPPLPPALKPDTFQRRQADLRAAAKTHGVEAIFVTPSTNLAWAANLAIGRSERLTALVLFADGPSVLVTPAFEEANHKRTAVVDEVRTWTEEEDPIALTAKLLAGRKSVAIEGTTSYATASALSAAASLRTEEAAGLFDPLRTVKSEEEQGFLKEAGRRTSLAITATHKRMRAGMTESELARILEEEFTRLLVRGGGLVQFGPSSAFPHGGPAERRLAKGDVVLIDCGCYVRGYTSDVTRTVSFGPPSDEVRKVYGVVDRAQQAGIGALKAGTTGEQADRAARRSSKTRGTEHSSRTGSGTGSGWTATNSRTWCGAMRNRSSRATP